MFMCTFLSQYFLPVIPNLTSCISSHLFPSARSGYKSIEHQANYPESHLLFKSPYQEVLTLHDHALGVAYYAKAIACRSNAVIATDVVPGIFESSQAILLSKKIFSNHPPRPAGPIISARHRDKLDYSNLGWGSSWRLRSHSKESQ